MLPNIPIQFQLKTINHYQTRKPKTAAAQDLKVVALMLKSSNHKQFQHALRC
ncbi:hypothetical protein [Neisseria dentiae]|uniref:hypothetical protein n=1 Tax=Neisseria dentiae TaxID=194197 RepID=UPI000DFD1319|nr:hypothetical protein [Neisseria dentiae]QMT45125.1 hypothetical protein H3L92_12135 [Neisseria dentiae]STZ50884.1 Uncharacterised protein [Neisseria dentiae]